MIARLRGVVSEKSADCVILDVHGVGYEVTIPFSTYYELEGEGREITLEIYTYVRPETLTLYGFKTELEKRLFMQLIQVSGIGPRLGIALLSGMPVKEVIRAITLGDVARLSGIPGVGKKTAERIALELKDKVKDLPLGEMVEEVVTGKSPMQRDVVSALVNLGYPKNKAEASVARVVKREADQPFDRLLKQALKELSAKS